ncbi:Ribosomal RNA large subunit methyltransferase I [Phycisphaerae bacterium RAS1]|nr:Ribosomal RNA large subunit methyltransferase I [Phycisphaerae bacterium RAS1]
MNRRSHGPPRRPPPESQPPDAAESPSAPPSGARQSPWVVLRSATFHPFIFRRMIGHVDPAARPGDVVSVYDKSNALFGRGLFNPKSEIVIRMLLHGDAAADDAFWQAKLKQAIDLRRQLRLHEQTDAYRLVHAEGDGLSGLIVERYADCLVLELFSLGMFQRAEQIASWVAAELGPPASLDRPGRAGENWHVLMRADGRVEHMEGFRVRPQKDAVPPGVVIREHGIRYRVDMAGGHKTGFFCDQRENRRRLAGLCAEASVLDVCCYTGGFGLAARLLGTARDVTCVDLDEAALVLARENANLNQARIDIVHSDAFVYLRQMTANRRQYDVVVLDPPKLARTRDEYEDALRKYFDLNQVAAGVVRPGGVLLTCSCSGLVSQGVFIELVHKAVRRAGRAAQLFDVSGAGPDHPVMLNCPESAYLKALWLRVI